MPDTEISTPLPTAKPPAPITRAHAARDVLVQIIGRIGNLLIGIVVVITITRALGVDGNGQWSTLMAISVIIGYVVDPGMQTAVLRMASAEPEDEAGWLGALLGLRLVTGIVAAIAFFAATVLVAQGPGMILAGALIAATALTSPAQALGVVFQMHVRNDRAIAFITLQSVLWTAGVVVIAIAHGGLVLFALAFSVSTIIAVIAQAIWVLRTTPVALDGLRRHGRRLLRMSIPLGIGSALTIAYGKVDQILVLHYGGIHGAGLYGAAYSLLDKVQFLPAVLMTTAYPILSSAWPQDPERTRRVVQRTLAYMMILSTAGLAFTIGAARPILVLLFGQAFAPAAGTLRVLIAGFVPACIGYVVGYLAFIVGRQKFLMAVAFVGLIFNVGANLLLIPRYGYVAAAWVTLATELLVISPALFISLRPMGAMPELRRIPRIVAAAAIMGGIVWGADQAGLDIFVLAVLGAINYPIAVVATGALTPEDRASLSGWVRRRVSR